MSLDAKRSLQVQGIGASVGDEAKLTLNAVILKAARSREGEIEGSTSGDFRHAKADRQFQFVNLPGVEPSTSSG
jgi:hypothetical protein